MPLKKYFQAYLIPFLVFALSHLQATTLYFVRHGQTDWNVEGKLQGHADIPLNTAGRAEAAELSEKLKQIAFTLCFSSDLQRALETARILSANRALVIEPVYALRERSYGPWEGRFFAELLEYEKQGHPLVNIESDVEIQERVFPLVDEIVRNDPEGIVLIVTHGSVIRSIVAQLLGIDSNSILSIQMKNLATLQLVASKGQYAIQEMIDIQVR